MFLKNSRYYGLETVTTEDAAGREVTAVKLRRLPATTGKPARVRGHDRVDHIAQIRYRDATKYWHVADANTELEAGELTREAGRTITVPET